MKIRGHDQLVHELTTLRFYADPRDDVHALRCDHENTWALPSKREVPSSEPLTCLQCIARAT